MHVSLSVCPAFRDSVSGLGSLIRMGVELNKNRVLFVLFQVKLLLWNAVENCDAGSIALPSFPPRVACVVNLALFSAFGFL
eukprot:2445128-Amphidinium_carterae.1